MKISNRYSAAALHLTICLGLAVCVYFLLNYQLYPSPLLHAVGGLEIFYLVLLCDVVIGPLLTLIVFKVGKPSLRFDLTVIALLQAAALAYGLHTLWAGRPVFLAALGHRVDLIQASDISENNLAEAKEPLPLFGPRWVGVLPPQNKEERDKIMWQALAGGGDYGHLPKYHVPIETMQSEMLSRASPISELKKLNVGKETQIDAWFAERKIDPLSAKFQGLKAPRHDLAVVIDGKNGSILGIAPFAPWN